MNTKLTQIPGNVTNILVIGGSYGGLSFIKNFIGQISMAQNNNKFLNQLNEKRFSITMVEPRSGFLNFIGLPRAIVDPKFAATQYLPYDRLKSIKFDNIYKCNEVISCQIEENKNHGFELNHIQGEVTSMDLNSIKYKMNELDKLYSLEFDYAVLATGRHRGPPISPNACDENSYIDEMAEFLNKVKRFDRITIIGAGAVGIEIAADIKQFYPKKIVNLIHPYSLFPPEPLTDEFKSLVYKSLKDAGINIFLETRISQELPNGNLLTTDGQTIESEFNYWSNGKRNNIGMISKDIKDMFVSKEGNLLVNEYLQLSNEEMTIDNIFCIGDIVELPVIKTAGWANGMGEVSASNIFKLLNNENVSSILPKEYFSFKSMVLVTGNGDLISEFNGQVEINSDLFVEEYKDYCLSKVIRSLGL